MRHRRDHQRKPAHEERRPLGPRRRVARKAHRAVPEAELRPSATPRSTRRVGASESAPTHAARAPRRPAPVHRRLARRSPRLDHPSMITSRGRSTRWAALRTDSAVTAAYAASARGSQTGQVPSVEGSSLAREPRPIRHRARRYLANRSTFFDDESHFWLTVFWTRAHRRARRRPRPSARRAEVRAARTNVFRRRNHSASGTRRRAARGRRPKSPCENVGCQAIE